MRSDIFLVVMSFKEMILNVNALLLQDQIQLFTGAIELPLIFFSIVQEHLQIIENRLLRNRNRVIFSWLK